MKLKSLEKVGQVASLVASVLALNGCDANQNNSDNKVDNTAPTSTNTAIITKDLPVRRAMLNECLKTGDPKYHTAYQAAYDKLMDSIERYNHPERFSGTTIWKGNNPNKRFQGQLFRGNSVVTMDLKSCGVSAQAGDSFTCLDDDANKSWERTKLPHHPHRSILSHDLFIRDYSLKPSDEQENPEKWNKVQRRCNQVYAEALKSIKKDKEE